MLKNICIIILTIAVFISNKTTDTSTVDHSKSLEIYTTYDIYYPNYTTFQVTSELGIDTTFSSFEEMKDWLGWETANAVSDSVDYWTGYEAARFEITNTIFDDLYEITDSTNCQEVIERYFTMD